MRNPHMKFQESSFNGLKVTVGTKSVTHAPTNGRSKSNMPHHFFQSWGHKYDGQGSPMLHTKFRENRPAGSGEDSFNSF